MDAVTELASEVGANAACARALCFASFASYYRVRRQDFFFPRRPGRGLYRHAHSVNGV